jgi:hypothetical protein
MTQSRSNLIWPVLIIGIGVIMLLISANVIPEAIGDLLIRSWPALLIIFGLNILLSHRFPIANWLVLILSVGLVVVVANLAYAERSSEYRTDYRESRLDVVPPEVEQMVIIIDVRDTRATISPSSESRQIAAQFEGSNESDVDIDVEIQGSTATITISEDRPGVLPRLQHVGRGTLNVFLPVDVPIDVLDYLGDDGSVTADFMGLNIRTINMQIERGNMRLCLPRQGIILRDTITVENGNLEVVVPPDTTLSFDMGNESQRVEYQPPSIEADYQFLVGGILETRLVEDHRILLNMNVEGTLTLNRADACSG